MNEALRDWVTNVADTFYCIGTAAGPHPYPAMVRDFQCVIGNETREQMLEAEGRLPDSLVACDRRRLERHRPVPSVPRRRERRDLRRRGGGARARRADDGHAASLAGGRPGVLHGNRTYLLHGRRRPDQRGPLDLRRPRLSRHRPRALLAAGERPGDLPLGDRQGGARRVPALLEARRHHPGARAGARARQGDRTRAEEADATT